MALVKKRLFVIIISKHPSNASPWTNSDQLLFGVSIHHFRYEKRTGNEMRPAIVPRIVTGGASVRYWSTSSLSLLTVPEVLSTVNLAHFDHSFFNYCPQILCQIFYERKNMTKEGKKLRKLTSVIITNHDLIIKIFSLYGAM